MAEVLGGGALLSGLVNVLLDRLATKEVLNFFRRKKVISDLLYEMKIKLLSANKLLNDAEEKQVTGRHEEVKAWLGELMEAVYEADHVIDKINTEAMRRDQLEQHDHESGSKACKCFNFVPTLLSAFDITIKSEIEVILGKLKLLLDQNQIKILGLRKVDPKTSFSSQKLPAPLVEESDVFGREADKEAIIKALLSDDVRGHCISVISIVGMGGIGKTTLAQLVYEDSRVQKYFELKEWVLVSEDFDVLKITKEIQRGIDPTKCGIEGLHQLQKELRNALMGKKFLFVLDDVWNETDYDSWDFLKSSLKFGMHGSKILVTTRSEIVATNMGSGVTYNLSTISDDDCLQLLAKHVFEHVGFEAHSNLQEIGLEIVKKCKGLPLAVKSIAAVLRSKSNLEEWRSICQSNVWKLQFEENQKNKILPALWLSYHSLPPQLKRCFAYCSIFPKDYKFGKVEQKKLILMWMAEGLLQPPKNMEKTMEVVGDEYLNALILRSFFQRSSMYKSTLLMHDLVHDLAMCISGEFCCVLDDYKDSSTLSNKIRHLSYAQISKEEITLKDLSNAKCLRTLLALPLPHVFISNSILLENFLHGLLLRDGGCLRTLSLSENFINELPESIGKLKHLRYLDVSGSKVKELPNSICKLYNLQTLLVFDCAELTQLPSTMSSLTSLRHLDIRDTPLKKMPSQMQNMTNLQTLSDFVLGKSDGLRIKELEKFQFSRGSLQIKGLENVVNVGDVKKANLKKKDLTELILRWDVRGDADNSIKEKEMEILDALEPNPSYLKKLRIIGYRGTKFSDWVVDQSYRNIVKITLSECKNCCLLPSFGQLSSLRKLTIEGLDQVTSIGDEFYGTSSLEELSIIDMYSLEKWSFTRADEEGRSTFHRLKKLSLHSCKKLKVGLPAHYLPSLKSVDISCCDEMLTIFPTSYHQQIDTTYPSLESVNLILAQN